VGVIQRVPQGVLDLLSMKGIENLPKDFSTTLIPIVDLLQFYGNQQRQLLSASGNPASGGSLTTPITTQWTVLFGGSVQATNTATMTFLSVALFAAGPNATIGLAAKEKIAAATTGQFRLNWLADYPMVFPPGTTYFAQVDTLGVDATVALFTSFSIGILG
jgi:hypothetical protein